MINISNIYLDRILHLFLLDIYAERFHQGIEGIPARRWELALQDGFTPRLPANLEEMDILLGRTEERTVQSYGIELFNLRYNHDDLVLIRTRLTSGEKVKIKYHPGDLSRIYVFNPFERAYLETPAVDQAYVQGLSLWKHQVILAFLRRERGEVNDKELAWAKRQIQTIVDEAKSRRKITTRSKVARWEEGGRSAPPLPATPQPPAELPALPADDSPLPPPDEGFPNIRFTFDPAELEQQGWGVIQSRLEEDDHEQ